MPRTVIVLGAGASKEADLPLGDGLKAEIAEALDIRFEMGQGLASGDSAIVEALRVHIQPERDINPHRAAARRIVEAMPLAISIDNFMDAHRGDDKIEVCGKLGIANTILKAERRSKLFHESRIGDPFPHSRLANTWYHSFFQVLTENCRFSDLEQRLSTVTLIVFNYDRCIEHYLYHAFATYYGVSHERSAALVKKLAIFHPYGSVGILPWCDGDTETTSEFGAEVHPAHLLKLASRIKTFTEGTDPSSSDIVAIRSKVHAADRILFLGFAFHRLNIEVLWDKAQRRRDQANTRCYATGKNISGSDAEVIAAHIANLGNIFMNSVTIRRDLSCSEIFPEYRRSLSMT